MMRNLQPPEPRICLREAALLVGLSVYTLGCLARGRRVPHYKLGGRYHFSPGELLSWLEEQHVEPLPRRRQR